jgi:hypothetical protein
MALRQRVTPSAAMRERPTGNRRGLLPYLGHRRTTPIARPAVHRNRQPRRAVRRLRRVSPRRHRAGRSPGGRVWRRPHRGRLAGIRTAQLPHTLLPPPMERDAWAAAPTGEAVAGRMVRPRTMDRTGDTDRLPLTQLATRRSTTRLRITRAVDLARRAAAKARTPVEAGTLAVDIAKSET